MFSSCEVVDRTVRLYLKKDIAGLEKGYENDSAIPSFNPILDHKNFSGSQTQDGGHIFLVEKKYMNKIFVKILATICLHEKGHERKGNLLPWTKCQYPMIQIIQFFNTKEPLVFV